MKIKIFLICLIIGLNSCVNKVVYTPNFKSASLKTIYEDKLSSRAILFDKEQVWFSGNNGKYGSVNIKNASIFKGEIIKDSLSLEFRSIAQTSKAIFVLSVGNPALLYKIAKDKKVVKLVYTEVNDKVFYDSMQFVNDSVGFAMGDPVLGCLNLIKTKNGGDTWKKITCNNLSATVEGEAAFAASNTNLIIRGKSIFMVSGGIKSRVFVSEDLGETWQVYDTPIVQGEAMTGIFTADFYNDKIGIVAGGNYEKQTDSTFNKALTLDGGKTWNIVGQNTGFGYASCIQFVPKSNGNEIVCVGGTGLHYSYDQGNTWVKLLPDTDLLTFRFLNNHTIIATGKNRIVRIDFK